MCKHCEFLNKIFNIDDMTPREYWLYTEMFIYLHYGKDDCGSNKKGFKDELN